MWFCASDLFVQVSFCCLILLREPKWRWHHHYAPRCCLLYGPHTEVQFSLGDLPLMLRMKYAANFTLHHFCITSIKWIWKTSEKKKEFFSPEMIYYLKLVNFTIRISLSHSVSKQLRCRRLWRSSAAGEEGSSHGNRFSSYWPSDHNCLLYCTLHHGTHLHKMFRVYYKCELLKEWFTQKCSHYLLMSFQTHMNFWKIFWLVF